MSKIEIVYQPLPKVHAELLLGALSESWVELAVLSSAFVVESGVALLLNELKARKEKVTLIAGIRNGVRSIQGLAGAFSAGTRVVIVDTGTRSRLFHSGATGESPYSRPRTVCAEFERAAACTGAFIALLLFGGSYVHSA